VPDYVTLVKIREPDPFHSLKDVRRFQQSAPAGIWEVDLGDVTRDYGLRIVSQTRDKHLHLFRCGVLRLIHDDERVIEGPAAHECDGRNLDDVLLEITIDLLLVHEIVQRVVQRTEVRIYFFLQGPGQKAETL